MKTAKLFLYMGIFVLLTSCATNDDSAQNKENESDTIAALKESIYTGPEVKIGDQIWMSENLNVDVFSNGEPIPEAKTAKEWDEAAKNEKPAWCYYDNDPENGKKFGKLYNWYAISDSRGLAPKGWHVASHEEWIALSVAVGGPVGKKIKKESGWDLDGMDGNGDNSSGFNGLPGGCRTEYAKFLSINSYGYWFTSTESDLTTAFGRLLAVYDDIDREESHKGMGCSVRCIKNK